MCPLPTVYAAGKSGVYSDCSSIGMNSNLGKHFVELPEYRATDSVNRSFQSEHPKTNAVGDSPAESSDELRFHRTRLTAVLEYIDC